MSHKSKLNAKRNYGIFIIYWETPLQQHLEKLLASRAGGGIVNSHYELRQSAHDLCTLTHTNTHTYCAVERVAAINLICLQACELLTVKTWNIYKNAPVRTASVGAVASVNWNQFDNLSGTHTHTLTHAHSHTRTHSRTLLVCLLCWVHDNFADVRFWLKITLWGVAPHFVARWAQHRGHIIQIVLI